MNNVDADIIPPDLAVYSDAWPITPRPIDPQGQRIGAKAADVLCAVVAIAAAGFVPALVWLRLS
jgi:hypothetical protein